MKKIILLGLTVSIFSVQPAFADSFTPYVRGGFVSGLYKMHGNEATDGHMPTKIMHGFTVAAGLTYPLTDNGVMLRMEGAYMFGFYHPSTDYSAFTGRVGIEIVSNNPVIIPYFMIGGGLLVVDPMGAYVQDGPMFDLTGGIRIPARNGFSIDLGGTFSRGFLQYSEKPNESQIDRVVGYIGLQKSF